MRQSMLITLAAALFLGLTGCGRRLYPVEGTVQFEDSSPVKTLAGGTVSLESVTDKSNAAGEIRNDGSFTIRDPFGKDGVAPGAYRVVVLAPEGADRRNPPIDRSFGRYETSGIEITVKEEANKITIIVRRPKDAKKG